MKRKTETAPPPPVRIVGYIVTQGGLPCSLYNAASTRRGGVCVPATEGHPVTHYLKVRDAKRAIARTVRVAAQLRGSLVDDWLKLSPLQSGQPYAVLPLSPSHT